MEAKLVQVPPQTIDDFGDVVKLRDAFAPTEKLYQRLRLQLAAQCAGAPPDAEFLVRGERYTLRISACSFDSRVDVPKARKRLGAAAFLECCSVTLRALAGYLTAPEVEALTIRTQTGSRSYNAIPLAEKTSAGAA